jgi:acetyl esterase/lipase
VFVQILLFLGLAGWGGLVALSLWPLRRPHKIAMGLYRFVYRATEVPHLFALLAVATVAPLFLVSEPGGGWLTAALIATALIAVGLAVLIGNGLRSWSAVNRGLVAAGLSSMHRRRSLWSLVIHPFARRPPSVELIRDVSYGDHVRQRLDIYRRSDGSGNGPVLVYFHGGGYFTGDKRRAGLPLLHHLADRGWLCVSANYRLRAEAGMAEHLTDARAVIAWAREHAADHGADSTTLMAAGSSAGALVELMCSLTNSF